MLDIKFIRENKELVAAGAVKKHISFDVESLLSVDDKRRALTTEIEKKRAEQNAVSDDIVKVSDQTEREKLISEMKILKESLQKEE
jgi:seryl-tRNA synthetase